MKIATIIGARPQFIKAAGVSRAIRDHYSARVNEILIHTGQHYDDNMSKVFFEELDIPEPAYNLQISGGSHGAMTGQMLAAIELTLLAEKPDWVLIYGDTNSTLAGALAAAKLYIPVAHVEAGLRSFNRRMPEEINRIVADSLSSLLFCPTATAVENLAAEGVVKNVHNVGDVMYDVALWSGELARASGVLRRLGLDEKNYFLATCHRAENTDDVGRLTQIMTALADLAGEAPVVFPLHPRTRKLLAQFGLTEQLDRLTVVDPLPFLDMVALERAARAIITDSGGVQKEAYFHRVPCVTMRDETEWVETVTLGWNRVVGPHRQAIVDAARNFSVPNDTGVKPYGDGQASRSIVEILVAQGPN